MKVAIIGANGQLGNELVKEYQKAADQVIQLNIEQLNITKVKQCQEVLSQLKVDLIINTAAMPDLEDCENNPQQAFAVNAIGAKNLALISEEIGVKLLHFSSDYVFDGGKKVPYLESDPALPLNVYGNSKLAGENFVLKNCQQSFVVRVSGLYGSAPCLGKKGLNFVKLMIKLAQEEDEVRVADDQILTPTSTLAIAQQTLALAKSDNFGLYHMTCQGQCSWYRFAQEIFESLGIKSKLSIAHPGEFPLKVARPKYSVLENAALKKIGLDQMPDWQEALKNYLTEI